MVALGPQSHVFSPTYSAPITLEIEERLILNLFQQGRLREAEQAAKSLTKRAPHHAFGWKAWGLILSQLGQKVDALPIMQRAAKLAPNDAEAYNNLGVLYQELGQLERAESSYRLALEWAPNNPRALGNLIDLISPMDRPQELLPLLRRKLALHPDDDDVRHQVAMLSGEQTDGAPASYVEKLFDGYAEMFDSHLQGRLDYRIPEKMLTLLAHRLAARPVQRVLDLGCGTGLFASALAAQGQRPDTLVGVDLSSKMLDKARVRGLYSELQQADVVDYMREQADARFDMVVATDVFIYVGKIDEAIAQARRVLQPGGLLAFSVEDLARAQTPATPQDLARGLRLETSGRYSHGKDHLLALAARHGMTTLLCEPTDIRKDKLGPIEGLMVVWSR